MELQSVKIPRGALTLFLNSFHEILHIFRIFRSNLLGLLIIFFVLPSQSSFVKVWLMDRSTFSITICTRCSWANIFCYRKWYSWNMCGSSHHCFAFFIWNVLPLLGVSFLQTVKGRVVPNMSFALSRSYWIGDISWTHDSLFLACILKRGSLFILTCQGELLTLITFGCSIEFGPAEFIPLHPLITYRWDIEAIGICV